MKVLLSPAAQKQVERLPLVMRRRVRDVLARLTNWPHVSGARPMRAQRAGSYRMRTGDYRIIFRVQRDELLIEKVGHRRDVYED